MKYLDDEVFLALFAYIEAAGRACAELPIDSVRANLLKFYLLPCGFCHGTCLSPVCMNDCLHARASIAQKTIFGRAMEPSSIALPKIVFCVPHFPRGGDFLLDRLKSFMYISVGNTLSQLLL